METTNDADSSELASVDVLQPSLEELARIVAKRYLQWKADRSQYDAPRQLAAIISDCWAASMRLEEQRPTRLRVICVDPNKIETPDERPIPMFGWDVGFMPETEVSPERLRKLGAAIDHSNSAIVVWDGETHPVVRGLLRFAEHGRHAPPHKLTRVSWERALRITVPSAGVLNFDNTAHIFAEFADGRLTFPKSLPILTRRWTPYYWMAEEFATELLRPFSGPFVLTPDAPNWHRITDWQELYLSTLVSILRSIQEHRCGGTIVITRDVSFRGVSDFGYRLSGTMATANDGMPTVRMRMNSYFESLLSCEHERLLNRFPDLDAKGVLFFSDSDFHQIHFCWSELIRAARFIGKLTAADGAVLLDSKMRIHAFGAKLKTDIRPICRHLTSEAMMHGDFSQPTPDISTLPKYDKPRGMRFNSAVSYAISDPNSLIFVASEDGPITALMSINGEVLVAEPISVENEMVW